MLGSQTEATNQQSLPNGSEYLVGEVDLREFFSIVWQGKWIIIAITFVFAIVALVFALSLPNIYRAETLLAPAEETQGGGLAAMASQLGGLASLAGVNLPKGQADKATLGVEVLKSRAFITQFIERRGILVPLMAAKRWDPNSRLLQIDPKKYDVEKAVWVREVNPPKHAEPSAWEAYETFRRILQVSRQKETGFVTVSIDHLSPEFAQLWVKWLVEDVNEHLRNVDIKEAQNSVNYLQAELQKTAVADMHEVFYQIIEKQIQTMMLANVRSEYVFKTIDAAVEPEDKHSPKRAIICIIATVFGGVIGMLVVYMNSRRRDKKSLGDCNTEEKCRSQRQDQIVRASK